MIVIDTSVWIDWFANRVTPQTETMDAYLDNGEDLALTDIILTEILQGLRHDRNVERVEARLAGFEVARLRDLDDFRRAAALYRHARSRGVTIRRTTDCLIASVCIRDDLAILHADADFEHLARVTDLRVVAPSS